MTKQVAPDLETLLKNKALNEGFDQIHITSPDAIPLAAERLNAFLQQGCHGDMNWLETHAERRKSPLNLWPDVKSIIMLGSNYGPDHNPLDDLHHKDRGAISVYAQGKDYHDVLKKKLKNLAGWLHQQTGHEVKVFVDTAPVMEKPLAVASGMGWQGKHTNLVSRQFGSWLFLGSIFTTASLKPDHAEKDHCGSCQRCLDICPTNAFPAPYQLDARRCIAYLTIEHKGHIAPEFRKPMGNRIYGCDDCLAICPWNKYAQVSSEMRFHKRPETDTPYLRDLLRLDDEHFRTRFAGTPIKRTGRDRFIRNVLIAAGNSNDKSLLTDIVPLLSDPSSLVRAMAVWACRQLMSEDAFVSLRAARLCDEQDDAVRAEWLGCNFLGIVDGKLQVKEG